jgi:hypothetical protein
MTANVAGSGGVPDSAYGSGRRHDGGQGAAPAPSAPAAEEPPSGQIELLLSIADDPTVGGFVYTTIDRRTGAVVRRLSRAQLEQLRETESYAAGALLSTRA